MSYKLTSQEVVEALKGIHQPDFAVWARDAFLVGQLEVLVQVLISCNKAATGIEAIQYLANYTNGNGKRNTKVTWGDMTKASSSRKLFKKLNELVTQENRVVSYDRSRYYGVISHIAIPKLFFGELIDLDSVKKKKNTSGHQMSFFAQPSKVQTLFYQKGSWKTKAHVRLVGTIEKQWNILRQKMDEGTLPIHSKVYSGLYKNLEKIFGSHVRDILTHGVLVEEHFAFKTMMIWASALLHYRNNGRLIFFREIWVLPNKCDIGAGRLDALIVTKVNDVALNPRQQSQIRQIASHEKFSSIGHVISRLVSVFSGSYLEFEIADWKFAVGDGVKGMQQQMNIINKNEVIDQPLPEHVRQIKRYMSLTMLSYRITSKRPGELWTSQSFRLKGKIVYLIPDGLPITHEVELSSEELKSVFVDQVANPFRGGKQQSLLVYYSNRYLNHAIKLLENNVEPMVVEKQPPLVRQLVFEGMPSAESLVEEDTSLRLQPLIEEHQTYIYKDDYKIFEVVGKDKEGKEILRAHYNRIVEQVELGNIVASKEFIRKLNKGHIACPLCGEKTPSGSISLAKDLYKCFGCGVSAHFFWESIPSDMHLGVRSIRTIKRETKQTRKIIIPGRHQEVMKMAQRALQRGFLSSPGAVYLEKERGLIPELSMHNGAGYGTLRFIESLLDDGVSYDELIHYGFLGISDSVREDSPLVKMLEVYQPLGSLFRSIPTNKKDSPFINGLPYSVLEGRVTWPLEIGGIYNNFYGRSIDINCPKPFRHRKLIIDHTEIPHGAYNMHIAMQAEALKKHPRLFVVESPINADTLRMLCYEAPSTTAIIGVNNDILFELLAGFEGDLIVGFDNDPTQFEESGVQKFNADGTPKGMTGQKNTLILAEEVRKYGFKGHILDFTGAFVKQHPEWNFQDINQFWTEYHQKIDVSDYVQSVKIPG